MKCLETQELLDFMEGRLPPSERDALEEHLDRCAACRLVVVELTRDADPVAPYRPSPAPSQRTTDVSSPLLHASVAPAGGIVGDVGGLRLVREVPGRYQVQRELRRGGQARILQAYDTVLGRTIALKELLESPLDPGPEAPLTLPALRFIREARIAGRLDHPAIVHVHEAGLREDGALYYTMPLIRGRTLAEAIEAAGDLPARLVLLRHFETLCLGVAYAHSQGVLHRDIKPHNVMIGEFGETVLLDWGLAKITRPPRNGEARSTPLDADARLTAAGTVVGTPAYMSPEQAAGQLEEVDERSDVWGLGAVLYEILTGRPPFSGDRPGQIMEQVLTGRFPSVRALCPQAPAHLAAAAERCLRRSRDERYPTAQALVEALRQTGPALRAASPEVPPASAGAPPTSADAPSRTLLRTAGWLGGALVLAAVLALGLLRLLGWI